MAEIKAMLTFFKKRNASFPIGVDVKNASAPPPAISSLYKDEKTVAVVDPSRGGLLNALFELKNGIQRQHR